MPKPFAFLKQSFAAFRTTGAVAPSSIFLARAMVDVLPKKGHIPDGFRVLEVGPGTGPFTAAAAKRMDGNGRLDLWEINPEFVTVLKGRLERERCFLKMGTRIRLHQGDVRELAGRQTYDAVLSGLPFNNFSPQEVRGFLEHFRKLLKPGGALAYFEYVAIRKLQAPFVSRERRQRLKGITQVVREFAAAHQVRQHIVPLNLPPARVRHLLFK